jgi:hypothetical protein
MNSFLPCKSIPFNILNFSQLRLKWQSHKKVKIDGREKNSSSRRTNHAEDRAGGSRKTVAAILLREHGDEAQHRNWIFYIAF